MFIVECSPQIPGHLGHLEVVEQVCTGLKHHNLMCVCDCVCVSVCVCEGVDIQKVC